MANIIFSVFIGLIVGIILMACLSVRTYNKGYDDARQYTEDETDMAYRKGFYDCLRDKEQQK